MKHSFFLLAFFAVSFSFLPLRVVAQSDINFPAQRYLTWKRSQNVEIWDERVKPLVSSSWQLTCGRDSAGLAYFGRRTFSDAFNYLKEDSNTTYTIYGVSIPLITGNGRGDVLDSNNQVAKSFRFDLAVYSGKVGDTTVSLLNKETFFVDSGMAPSVVMHFNDSMAIGMYEFYFKNPVTVTGLFFVGTGMRERPAASIHVYDPETSRFPRAYCNVVISDDSLVEGYYTSVHDWHNGSCWGYDFDISYGWLFWEGRYTARAVQIPDVYQPLPLNLQPYMTDCQQLYPILQYPSSAVDVVEKPMELRLMPNPASERVTIVADRPVQGYRVLDMAGRVVLAAQSNAAAIVEVDVQMLPPGVYAVQVETGTGRFVQRLSVIR